MGDEATDGCATIYDGSPGCVNGTVTFWCSWTLDASEQGSERYRCEDNMNDNKNNKTIAMHA